MCVGVCITDTSALVSDLSTVCGRCTGLWRGPLPRRQTPLQNERVGLLHCTPCLDQLTFHPLRPNRMIFVTEAHRETSASLIQWALEGSDNDQFTRDYYSSQNLSSAPMKSTTHLSHSVWYAVTIHHFQMFCCFYRTQHTHTNPHCLSLSHTHTSLFFMTPLNKLFLTSEIAILVQGYSFSQQFPINSFFLLRTFPPAFPYSISKTANCSFPLPALSLTLPPSPSDATHPLPPCLTALTGPRFRRWVGVGGGFDPSMESCTGSGVHSPTTGRRALSHQLKSHEGF